MDGKVQTLRPLLPIRNAVSRYSQKLGLLQRFEEFIAETVNRDVELSQLVKEFDDSVATVKSSATGVNLRVRAGEHFTSKKIMPGIATSTLETVPPLVLETLCQLLTVVDLLQLCQVSRNCYHFFGNDEIWNRKAEERGIVKAVETESWKWNFWACESRLLSVHDFSEAPVLLEGDVTFIDPFKIFFTGKGNETRSQALKDLVDPHLCSDSGCVVTYRGIPVVFVSSRSWDSDTAFEIIRNGTSLGADTAPSKVIAVIPKKLVDMLIHENGIEPHPDGGVFVEGVSGMFLSSRDGDFMIRGPGLLPFSHDIPAEEEEFDCGAIICATGGKWTIFDDTSDDEDVDFKEDMDEDRSRFLQEILQQELEENYGVNPMNA